MILLYGAAGSGKSTQAEILAEKYGWKHVSPGELLRKEAETDEALREILDSGRMVSGERVNDLIFESVDPVGGGHIIVDGYPREVGEAKDLIERYSASMIAAIVILDLSEEESIKRLKLRGRTDDTDDAIRKRLDIYKNEMRPIVDFFTENNVLIIHINGEQTIEGVSKDIEKELIKWQVL